MSKIIRRGVAGLAGLTLALFFSASTAWAEIEVLESTVPAIKAGSVLKDDARLKLPAGATVRVLLRATGATKTLKGPFEGAVTAYKDGRSWRNRLLGPRKDPEPLVGGARRVKPNE